MGASEAEKAIEKRIAPVGSVCVEGQDCGVTAAPAVLDLIVSAAMMDIYRPPNFRTSITTVLPEPTVIAIPEFTIISGLVVKT